MSRENGEIVRYPLSVRKTPSRRSLEERLTIRFPGVAAVGARAIQRLPPRSRLRQKMVRRFGRLFLEAYNRRDFEAAYSLYRPDSETIVPHQLVEVGSEPVTPGGPQANIDLQRRWHADWGEFRIEPEEAIDLDNRLLLLGRIRGSGLSSGAGIDTDWGLLASLQAGWIVSEQVFFDHRDALEAAGLRE